MFKRGDIVQIVEPTHPWYPCLLVVDEPKSWGVKAVCVIPESNTIRASVGLAYNRLTNEEIRLVGHTDLVPDIE